MQKNLFIIPFFILISSCGLLKNSINTKEEILEFHQNSILVDTHNDVMIRVVENGEDISKLTSKGHSDLSRFKTGGVDLQIFSVWLDPNYEKSNPYQQTNKIIDSVISFAEKNPNDIIFVKNFSDIKRTIKEKKFGALIGIEGGHPIENDLQKLENLYNRGTRYLALTWNNSTSWASSARDEAQDTLNQKQKGLTEFGKNVVKKMNQLGMIIDVSHVGEKTFNDIISISEDPIIASHSCVYNISPHFRNLKDYQIKSIAKNGGVIFLNFYAGFLDSTFQKNYNNLFKEKKYLFDSLHSVYKNDSMKVEFMVWDLLKGDRENILPPLKVIVDHIDYIKNLTGSVDNIGFGADFDGADAFPHGIVDVTSYPKLTEELFLRGYSKMEIRKILGLNFLRVFKKVCG